MKSCLPLLHEVVYYGNYPNEHREKFLNKRECFFLNKFNSKKQYKQMRKRNLTGKEKSNR